MSCARLSVFALAAVVAGASVAFACSSSPTILPVKEAQGCTLQIVGVTVMASKQINPSADGAPRPVQFRIYQLKTDTRMLNAPFDRIWKDDKATLQDDLVKVDEFPVYPDTRTEVKFERDPAALFVVGVALFREPKGRNWWTEFELPPAPGKGNCGMVEPKCSGPNCPQEGGAPVLAPHYAIWIDGTRVDDGSDHLDDYPDATRVSTLTLHAAPAPAAAGDGGK
ncbi:MAG TPA: type VI secretion system lipoprotein TssJ [Polyangiaceae bacterium]